jgi:hypothetical protein
MVVMTNDSKNIKTLWLLRGDRSVPGWGPLEADARSEKIAVVIFDRDAGWALIRSGERVDGYEGMIPEPPRDGLYVSEHGYPIYVVAQQEVSNANKVIATIGEPAETLMEEIGDPDTVLQRLGYAY